MPPVTIEEGTALPFILAALPVLISASTGVPGNGLFRPLYPCSGRCLILIRKSLVPGTDNVIRKF